MIATATTTATTMATKTGAANMHANTAGAPLPLLPRRVSSSSSIASASSAASIADLTNEDDGSSSSSSSSSSTPRKARRVRGMHGVPPPELAAVGPQVSSPPQLQQAEQQKSVPFPTSVSAPAAVPAASPIQKSQPLLYTPGMSLMSLRLASLPKPQSPQKRPGPSPLPLSPPSGAKYTSALSYTPASYSKPASSSPASYSHTHTHAYTGQQRSLSSPPAAMPKTPTTPLTPGGTPEVRKKCGQLVKSSLKSSRSYSSSSSMSISSSSSMSIDGTPLPASSSGLSVFTTGSASYASSRSEPTTPTASKAVHFDNARLEFVRLFLAEQKPLAVSRDGSPTPDGDGEYNSSGGEGRDRGRENGEWPGWIFGSGKEKEREAGEGGLNGDERPPRLAMNLSLQPPPGLLTDPRLVALESMRLVQASPSAGDSNRERETAVVHGSVRVRNLAYSKAVWARFTLDGWRTTSEVCARWVESVGGAMNDALAAAAPAVGTVGSDELGAAIAAAEEERRRRRGAEWDRFAFTIDLSGLALGDVAKERERRLELAVKYVVDGREQEAMWDNNGGRNYVATFVRERAPASSNTTTTSAAAQAMAKSVAAANQAYYAQQASLHQQNNQHQHQQIQNQQHLPQRRLVRRLRVQEHAVEDGSGSSEESTETEARAAVSRRGRVMVPVRAASAPAASASAGVQPTLSSLSSSKAKGRGVAMGGGGVSVRATEEERDMADLKSKLEKVAAQGDNKHQHQHNQHQHQHKHHHASPSRAAVGGGGGSSSSSQSSTPTTYTYTAMHHTHSMSMSTTSVSGTKRSHSPTKDAATSPSPSAPVARASAIHQRTQSFPQSSWRGQQLAHHQHQQHQQHQTSIYGADATYVYPQSSSFSRSPQQHLGSPRDLWDGDDSAFNRHARSAERGYFDILPVSSQAIMSRSGAAGAANVNAIRVTVTGSTPPQAGSASTSSAASSGSHSPSSSPSPPSAAYPPPMSMASSSTRGVGLGMSLLSPDSALSTPGMVSPASTSSSSSSSSSEEEEDDDEDVNPIDVAMVGHLAAAAHQHQIALEEGGLEGVIPVSVKGGVAVDGGETPYRQFLNKFCFFTGPGTGATSPLNTAVSLVPVSLHHNHSQSLGNTSGSSLQGHAHTVPDNAHAIAYQALPGASPPRHQRGHGCPTPSSSVETVVGLGARA
ncbi:hypothetical protein D9619_012209 [Psilocybe cf. subviscida]|uniref:CBM21 domain-containing protein n=1 Tax=Psilocybe cf. subviscida TaxID=2480587 RepID=A0A8H5B7G3_9AGAR|nr:hypothetical protein D9619_012209 [Psilocybe cf. subviscida]